MRNRRPKLTLLSMDRHSAHRLLLAVIAATALLADAGPVEAQRFGYGRSNTRVRPGDGLPDVSSGSFTYCRLAYYSVRRDGSGNGWTTDFPDADRNLMVRLPQLTTMKVSRWSHGEEGFAVLQMGEPEIYECPMLMATDVGELGFNADDAAILRDYLLKGGFFWADDFWGSAGWSHFSAEIQRVLPEYPLVELNAEHPLFNQLYVIPEVPQIPSANSWRGSGGSTSELGRDSERASMWAMMDESGRILVLITHNTDISDGWERENYSSDYFYTFSPSAYAVVINVLLWVMSH
jgi:hypothetical protein